ncbi:MAG: hypothetical protein AB7I36_09495 [Rhodospirillaceae bacterium]
MVRLVYFPILFAAMSLAVAGYAQDRVSDAPSDSEISLSGKVAAIEQDSFTLDYGAGRVSIDLEDGLEWFPPGTPGLTIGEPVTVNGRIDDTTFTSREIEATSIYRPSTQTYLYSDASNARYFPPMEPPRPADTSWVNLSGTVKGVTGRDFVLDTGVREFHITTGAMRNDPVAVGKLRPGSRVTVSGLVNGDDIFDHPEIDATNVVVLSQPTKRVIIRRE